MAIDAESVVDAFVRGIDALNEATAFSWVRHRDGAVAFCTTARFPLGNGVTVVRPDAPAASVATLLDEVGAAGYDPYLELRPQASAELQALAVEREMRPEPDQPLMVLDALERVPGTAAAPGVSVEPVSADGAEQFAQLLAAGFGGSLEVARVLAHPSVFAARGLRCYLARFDGVPAAIASGHTVGQAVNVFNVATRPEYRRRGIATALTTHVLHEARRAGAIWAALFSSPEAYRTYQRLGFVEIEAWRTWTSP